MDLDAVSHTGVEEGVAAVEAVDGGPVGCVNDDQAADHCLAVVGEERTGNDDVHRS